MLQITRLIHERIRLLNDVLTAADFFFAESLAPMKPRNSSQEGDAALALAVLERAAIVLAAAEFARPLDAALRAAAVAQGIKPGQMFERSAWLSVAARRRHRFSAPWKLSAATPACGDRRAMETESLINPNRLPGDSSVH